MKIDVYTKSSCAACLFTKNYLNEQGMTFTELIVDKDITVDEVRKISTSFNGSDYSNR